MQSSPSSLRRCLCLLGCSLVAGFLVPASALAAPTMSIAANPKSALPDAPAVATVTLTGFTAPVGTIQFTLYGPTDPTCAATPVFTAPPIPATASVTSYTSAAFLPHDPGTYRWVASYSGDATNVPAPAATACDDPAAQIVVTSPLASPTLTSTPSVGVPLGGTIFDSATLANATDTASGAVTFKLYGPGDTTCSSPLTSSAAVVSGNDEYDSDSFVPIVAGTYHWVAAYSGDASNAPATEDGACTDPTKAITVTAPPPAPVVPAPDPGFGSVSDGSNALQFTPHLTRTLTGRQLKVRLTVPANDYARISYVTMRGTEVLTRKAASRVQTKNHGVTIKFTLPKTAAAAKTIRVYATYQGITVSRLLVRRAR